MKIYLGMALAILAMPSFASADITTNLQEYWSLDGNATAGINSDALTGHNGTYVGSGTETYATGKFGLGIDLERGSDEYLDIDNSVTAFDHVGGSISVSAWVNFEDDLTNWQGVIGNGEDAAWRLAAGRNGDTDARWASGNAGDIASPPPFPAVFDSADTGFHHLVGIYDGDTDISSLWVDGVLAGSGTATGINVPGLTDNQSGLQTSGAESTVALGITIGNNSDRRDRSFDGIIDDVGIWDDALTEAEVGLLWNGGVGTSVSTFATAVPEPSSFALIFGLAGFAAARRRRRS